MEISCGAKQDDYPENHWLCIYISPLPLPAYCHGVCNNINHIYLKSGALIHSQIEMQCRAWDGLINISTRLSFQFLPQNRPWAEMRGRKRENERGRLKCGGERGSPALCLSEWMNHVTGHVALSDKAKKREWEKWQHKSKTLSTVSQHPASARREREKQEGGRKNRWKK